MNQNTVFSTNKTLNVDGRLIHLNRPHLMGILNVTPDSFFDGGRYLNEKTILDKAEQMLCDGATFIDIGGYSSRPGAEDISIEEEKKRALFAIKLVRQSFPSALLAIDTFRSEVARAALDEGVVMINDISAGELDPEMPALVASRKVPYVIMHMRGTPQTMNKLTDYENLLKEMVDYFQGKIHSLQRLGITDIIIDPGFGFAKTMEQNFNILQHLEYLHVLGKPLLIGLSRKSMIWKSLDVKADEALNGTTVLNTLALMKGANILRVHDVKEAKQIITLWDKMNGNVLA